MKKYFCDYCEQEMMSPWMTIHITESSTWHYCQKCAMKFLEVFQEMEEKKEEEK